MSKLSRVGTITIISLFAVGISVGVTEARNLGGGGGGHPGGGGGFRAGGGGAHIGGGGFRGGSIAGGSAGIRGGLAGGGFRVAFPAVQLGAATRRWDGRSQGFARHRDLTQDLLLEISAG